MVCVKSMLRGLLRCSLALGLIVGGVAMTADNARAQAWGVAAPAGKKTPAEIEAEAEKAYQADADKRAAKEAQKEKEEAEAKEAEAALAAMPDPDPAPAAAPAAIPRKGKARSQVAESAVPGCAPGNLCTVCVAGCGTHAVGIVHVGRNPARKE